MVSGSSQHGRVLPGHRAAAAPGAALRRRRRPAARPRPVHGAAAARAQRRHQRADDRHLPLRVAEPDRLLGRRRHRLAADPDRARASSSFQRIALGDQRRFVTHGGKAFRVQARPSKLAAPSLITYGTAGDAAARRRPRHRRPVAVLERDDPRGASSRWTTSGASSRSPASPRPSSTSLVVSLVAVAIALPIGFVASSLLLRSKIHGWHRTDARPHRHPARSASRPSCSAPRFLLAVHPRAARSSTAAAGSSSSCTSR